VLNPVQILEPATTTPCAASQNGAAYVLVTIWTDATGQAGGVAGAGPYDVGADVWKSVATLCQPT
jgi:hypothetical protein